MSSLLVADVAPRQQTVPVRRPRLDRTEPVRPLPTVQLDRPRRLDPAVPVWAERVESTIETIAGLGLSATPTIVLVSTLIVAAALRHG